MASINAYPSDRALRNWLMPAIIVVAVLVAFLRLNILTATYMGFDAAIYYLVDFATYNRTVIASNYFNDGFVRRGLGGTIATLLSPDWRQSTLFFVLFSFVLLLLPLILLVRSLADRLPPSAVGYMGLVLAFSPQTFLGWSRDPARTDMFVGGCIALAVVCALHRKRLAAIAMVLIGMLAHETAIVFGAPLLLAMNWMDYRAREIDRRLFVQLALTLIAGVGIILLAQTVLSAPNSAVAAHMLAEVPDSVKNSQHRLWRDIAIYMAVAGPDALRTAICANLTANPQYLFMAIAALLVTGVYGIVFPLRRHWLTWALVMAVPLVFMLLIANDTGRWLKLAVLNGWLVSVFYLVRGYAVLDNDETWMPLGVALLMVLLAMGSTPYYRVNRIARNTALTFGYRDPLPLRVWMDTCDPGWERHVYGVAPPRQPLR